VDHRMEDSEAASCGMRGPGGGDPAGLPRPTRAASRPAPVLRDDLGEELASCNQRLKYDHVAAEGLDVARGLRAVVGRRGLRIAAPRRGPHRSSPGAPARCLGTHPPSIRASRMVRGEWRVDGAPRERADQGSPERKSLRIMRKYGFSSSPRTCMTATSVAIQAGRLRTEESPLGGASTAKQEAQRLNPLMGRLRLT